jgi:hypothetical protein
LPDHSLDQHVELVSTAGRICPQVRADSPCFMSRWRISRARLSASSVAELSPMDSHPMRAAAPTTKSFFIPQSPPPKNLSLRQTLLPPVAWREAGAERRTMRTPLP